MSQMVRMPDGTREISRNLVRAGSPTARHAVVDDRKASAWAPFRWAGGGCDQYSRLQHRTHQIDGRYYRRHVSRLIMEHYEGLLLDFLPHPCNL